MIWSESGPASTSVIGTLGLHAASDELLRRLVAGDAAVRLGGRESCSWTDSGNTSGDGTGERAQLGVTATRRGGRLARGPVGHLPVLDLRSAQTTNRSPAAGPQRGPASRSTVPDIAGADGDHASLRIVEMSAQHRAISRRKFGPTGHADDDDLIGEDRRLLRLIGQSVDAAKPDEQITPSTRSNSTHHADPEASRSFPARPPRGRQPGDAAANVGRRMRLVRPNFRPHRPWRRGS